MELNNTKSVNNSYNNDYVLSSADLMAVKHGIKKVTRIGCNTVKEFKQIQLDFEKHNLKTVISDKKLFGKYNIYISRHNKYAQIAKKVDPSYRIIDQKMSFNDSVEYVKEFSKLLSYPKCCYEGHIDNILKNVNIKEAKIFTEVPSKIDFVYNNCLNGFSNLYISFHLPCSFKCKNSVKYEKEIYKVVKKESPSFAKILQYYLKRPYLIFMDSSLGNMYVSWDNRSGFFFDGKIIKNTLFYLKFYYFKTNYPDYAKISKKNNVKIIAKYLNQGNTIKFMKDGFKILNNNKILYYFKDTKNLISKFLNFI